MSNESMKLGEGFSVTKMPGGKPPTTPASLVPWGIGTLIASILAALSFFLFGGPAPSGFTEKPGLTETMQHKIGGVLHLTQIRHGQAIWRTDYPIPNQIINAGETALRDCFIATSCTPVQNFKYHAIGTSSAAIAETQTACQTELSTQYNPDNTRATGSQTNNGANIYRTVGTNTVDSNVTIEEFCLLDQAATGGGTMWTRILTGSIALTSGDSLQTTYDLTIE